jgi:hypothetical protein
MKQEAALRPRKQLSGPGSSSQAQEAALRPRKQLSRRGALLGLVVAALLAGCADPGGGGAGSGGQASPTSSTAAVTTSTTTVPTTGAPATSGARAPSTSRSDGSREQTRVVVRGTVREGVEPGCRLLEVDQARRWLLVGGGRDADKLVPGARVEVVGVRVLGLLSYCQQGRPLRVLSVRRLP